MGRDDFLAECFFCDKSLVVFNKKFDRDDVYEAICLRTSCEISSKVYRVEVSEEEVSKFEERDAQ